MQSLGGRWSIKVIGAAAFAAALGGGVAQAQLTSCAASCYEKRFTLAQDQNGNGLPDPGDVVEYEVTFCNSRRPTMGPLDCVFTDTIDSLNMPGDLTLVEDPLNPGSFGTCIPDDDGQTSCTAVPNAVTIDSCTQDVATDTVTVDTTITAADACLTYTFFAMIDPNLTGVTDICNQAQGSGVSDDPNTPAAMDPTCFTVDSPPPTPTITKIIRGCPAPCGLNIESAPGDTTVIYDIAITNNDPNSPLDFDFHDDVPAGATGFRVTNKGDGTPCGVNEPPVCANIPSPGGANGTGEVVINGLLVGPAGGIAATVNLTLEVDFACPPVTDGATVSNQAQVFTTTDTRCDPCLSDDPGTTASPDVTSFTANCLPPPTYTVDKSVDNPVWTPSESTTLTYTIVITNTGTSPMRNIQIFDLLPVFPGGAPAFDQGLTCSGFLNPVVTPASLNGTCDPADCSLAMNPGFDCSILEILPGATATITFSIIIPDTHVDNFQVCNNVETSVAMVSGPGDEVCTLVDRPQVVEFRDSVKSVTPPSPNPGQAVTYTIVVENSGTGTANNVVLIDQPTGIDPCLTVPAGWPTPGDVTVVPLPPSPDTYDAPNRILTVPIDNSMPAGTMATVTITGLLAGPTTGTCCNQAFISSTEVPSPGQPTGGANPGDQTCVQIGGSLSVDFRTSTKAVSPRPMTTLQPLTYTLTVTNSGTSTANNVVVTDAVPACLTVPGGWDVMTNVTVSGSPVGVMKQYVAPNITVTIPTMAASEMRTITITGLIAGPIAPTCCNQATMVSNELPSPGHRTDDPTQPGASDQTCAPIQAQAACDLHRDVVAAKTDIAARYDNICTPPADPRLGGDDGIIINVVDAAVVDTTSITPTLQLTMYQLSCPCANVARFYKNPLMRTDILIDF